MISYLRWKIILLDFNELTVLTSGWVWYHVLINELTYTGLVLEEEINMFIYHNRTENSESLFWFLDIENKKVFSELIKISWIGWKVAMQILSLWISRLVSAIEWKDNKTIEWIKWIWKKMAEKIILELKDKNFGIDLNREVKNEKWEITISWDLFNSIKETLVNMWYNTKNIEKILQNLPEDLKDAWDIIPYVIRKLS